MNINAEQKKMYFTETALALNREGFHTETILGGTLGVWLDDEPLCEVSEVGGIIYRGENIATPERVAAKDKAYRIVSVTAEYMKQMEQAPPLKAVGLEDQYKLLAEFNSTVFAGMYGRYGVQFVTWERDHDGAGLHWGHYFRGNYDGAKQDFATRSGLISEQQLFGKLSCDDTASLYSLSSHSYTQWGQLGEILGGVRFPEGGASRWLVQPPMIRGVVSNRIK